MKSLARLVLAVVILTVLLLATVAASEIQVCFSPPLPQGCDATQTVIETINAAQHQVLVQAYSFTSAPIAKAVVDAKRRGLDVRVILAEISEKSRAKEWFDDGWTRHAKKRVPVLTENPITTKIGIKWESSIRPRRCCRRL